MREAPAAEELLTAPHVLEYEYRRSVGAVIGAFLGALEERRILGAKTAGGRVIVPPQEYDPENGESITELVEVGQSGAVASWTWNAEPAPGQPLGLPFAWALVLLEGADTAMLHAVDAGEASRMRMGMRVRARWREQRRGHITDIECFEPEVE